jgi:hypothetical protein
MAFYIECYNTDINKEDFTNIIKKCDIIITQPIKDNYRNLEYLSTIYVKHHAKPGCKIILVDSCYFNFYYFDLTYKNFKNQPLHKPCDYHYNNMIECYNNGLSKEYYIDNVVNNIDFKSSEQLEIIAKNSLNELYNRHINNKEKYRDINIISTYEYIKENYKIKLLFYSMNHPSKHLIQFICEKIISILYIENTINYNIDTLDNTKCILYKCISKAVKFNIDNKNALLLNITDHNKITQLYYDTYTKLTYGTTGVFI